MLVTNQDIPIKKISERHRENIQWMFWYYNTIHKTFFEVEFKITLPELINYIRF